jgi:hypothetical protein
MEGGEYIICEVNIYAEKKPTQSGIPSAELSSVKAEATPASLPVHQSPEQSLAD